MNYTNTTTRISRIIGVVLLSILLTSCDDFLIENPQSEVGVTEFYQTNDDFVQAVNAIYKIQQNIYTGNQAYVLNDLRSDNIVGGLAIEGNSNAQLGPIDQFSITSANTALESLWRSQYSGISRANNVITFIEDRDFPNKGEIVGQAKALRALFYFNLVREFGEVQLVTEPDIDINTARVGVDSVYALIISDLQDAANSLPDTYADAGADEGRITSGAAKSLLGTVYLTRNNFTDAEAVLGEVVNSGTYELRDDYGDLWISDQQGNGNESVWRVIYKADQRGNGSRFANWFAPSIGNAEISLLGQGKGTAFGFFIPTYDIINAYSNNDERKECIATSFQDIQDDGTTETVNARYVKCYVQQGSVSGGRSSPADWYIIRYANVLLRYAEALNENGNGDPLFYVNQVRRRAGLSDTTASGQAAIREVIYNEQRLESPFEGHRWNNLVRTGRAVSVINSKIATDSTSVGAVTNISDRDLLYAIPNRVISTSGVEQNPGY